LKAYFVRGGIADAAPGSPTPYFYINYFSYSISDLCDLVGVSTGWYVTNYCKKKFTIEAKYNPSWRTDLRYLLEGLEVNWRLSAIYSSETPHMDWSATLDSGTVALESDGMGGYSADIEIEFTLDNANISHNWPTGKSVDFRLICDTPLNHIACKDACGNYSLGE